MQFIYPYFLFALGALAIPVIIHLFNFRRFKKVYFTNVQLLKNVQLEQQSHSRLKHLLVLLARCLTLIFLILAFAQPYIPHDDTSAVTGKRNVSVYIDNSFSMNALGSEGNLLKQARQKAIEVAGAYNENDRFQLITNSLSGKEQRLISKQEFIDRVNEVEITPEVRFFNNIYNRQKEALQNEPAEKREAFFISDFQKANFRGEVPELSDDTLLQISLIPLQAASAQNIFIDSAWFASPLALPGQATTLIIRLVNTGKSDLNQGRVTLKVDNQIKGISEFTVPAGSQVIDTLAFTVMKGGIHKGLLSITDHPVTFDDNWHFIFNVSENLKVLNITEGQNDGNQYIRALFAESELIDLHEKTFDKLEYEQFNNYELIILNNLKTLPSGLSAELHKYLNKRAQILIFPSPEMEVQQFNQFLRQSGADEYQSFTDGKKEVEKLELQDPIFRDVFEKVPDNMDLPVSEKSYHFKNNPHAIEKPLLTYAGGESFISKYESLNGTVYLSAVPLDRKYTNLPVHALFVSLLHKMVLSGNASVAKSFTIGQKEPVRLRNMLSIRDEGAENEQVFHVEGNGSEFIPAQRRRRGDLLLEFHGQIKKDGFYKVTLPGTDIQQWVALNYDRRESELEYLDAEQIFDKKQFHVIRAGTADLSAEIRQLKQGTVLWKLCLIFALIFIAAEILLLRFWKQ